jgi:sugar O-acyltransferase (sialic acid O-acetyltransferase NeuD family)
VVMTSSVMRIAILGAGGHAQVIVDVLRASPEGAHTTIFFLDDDPSIQGMERVGIPVAGLLEDLPLIAHDGVIVGIGDNATRHKVAANLAASGEHFVTAIHPRAVVAKDVQIGVGTVIFANAVVNTGSRIGAHVILNTACTVDHHNRLSDFLHIAPGAHLGGDVVVNEGAFVGMGASVMPQRTVGAWATVGAGALVQRDVRPGVTVIGVPAREIS